MKIIVALLVSFVLFAVLSRPSLAVECRSDMECNMLENEKCVKTFDSPIGACVKPETKVDGKIKVGAPENVEESKPASQSGVPSGRGRFCMTKGDCGPGESCVIKENAVAGTCY